MRSLIYWAFALSISSAHAFSDTSLFGFFSTSEILLSFPRIATAASITQRVTAELAKCPSDYYVLVRQPGANAADFADERTAPHLAQWLAGGEPRTIRSSVTVADVVGELDTKALVSTLEQRCGAKVVAVDSNGSYALRKTPKSVVLEVDLPSTERHSSRLPTLKTNDIFLSNFLSALPPVKYSVIYTSTPLSAAQAASAAEQPIAYEMDDTTSPMLHMDLKRDLSLPRRAANGKNDDGGASRPLFDKYQFFTPGIFMAGMVSVLLLVILYMAISAIASLQVSYGAFDKEMGPAVQKKQQ